MATTFFFLSSAHWEKKVSSRAQDSPRFCLLTFLFCSFSSFFFSHSWFLVYTTSCIGEHQKSAGKNHRKNRIERMTFFCIFYPSVHVYNPLLFKTNLFLRTNWILNTLKLNWWYNFHSFLDVYLKTVSG